ncbi:signal peptide-containing protein [Cryptosporidium canis]|uniref:Signal peptide-containing protein n=1 Tax=Cryptosporidium canis TaxID=195482 RepID=A0ABQ8P2T3_9CRYT|nr:signal peptide-containing protein [Cryptosporidium canis]
MRAMPVVTSLLSLEKKEEVNQSQYCLLETLKQLAASNGRIPPKITRKKIGQAVLICKDKVMVCEYPTVIEETIYMTLGQYGHLAQIDTSKALEFMNEIQKEITTPVSSYTRMYKLSQNSNFCRLYEDFILSAHPNEYHVSFLPEEGERCQELLKRVKQNSFYSYWSQGGVVADQAQPIVDDKVSNEPISTKDTVINNIFTSPPAEEVRVEEIHRPKEEEEEQVEYENVILSRRELEAMDMEEEKDDSGCCSGCSCSSKKGKNEKGRSEKDVMESNMAEEELEKEEKSGCCSCSSSKKKSKSKSKSQDESKPLNDIIDGEEELEKEEKSGCCSCSSSKKKSKSKSKSQDGDALRAPEGTLTEEERELRRMEEEMGKEEKSGCCSCSSSKKKSKSKSKSQDEEAAVAGTALEDDLEDPDSRSDSGCCSCSSKGKSSKSEADDLIELERNLEEEEKRLSMRVTN